MLRENFYSTSDMTHYYSMNKNYGQLIILHRKGQEDITIWEGWSNEGKSFTWVETFNGLKLALVLTKDMTPGHIGAIKKEAYKGVSSVTVFGFRTIVL